MWRVPIFCEIIKDIFNPAMVIDVGCAIGDFVQGFIDMGISAWGIEGSKAAEPFMQTQNFIIADICEIPLEFGADFCMCLEVAEHIEASKAEIFIKHLVMNAPRILFSAAPPGQKGHHHVNCQPIEYWDELFRSFYYLREDKYADQVKERLLPWKNKPGLKAYYNNLHFYRRA